MGPYVDGMRIGGLFYDFHVWAFDVRLYQTERPGA